MKLTEGIPIGDSKYIIVQDEELHHLLELTQPAHRWVRIVRRATVCGAEAAYEVLKPDRSKGERLYLEVGQLYRFEIHHDETDNISE